MCKRKGFSLVELLTVISIISLLMAILLPVLNRARRNARSGVCQSNLRQWGIVFKMYTDEYDGLLIRTTAEPTWYYPIREYYSSTADLLLCPSAKKPSNPEGRTAEPPYGGTFLAWGNFFTPAARPKWDTYGSYGMNHWAYMFNNQLGNEGGPWSGGSSYSYSFKSDENGTSYSYSSSWSYTSHVGESDTQQDSRYWKNAYVTNSNNVPLVFDSWWLYGYCNPDDPPPKSNAIPRVDLSVQANHLCMDRHSKAINSVFMDFSVRKVGLKELWVLKWYPEYNTAGRWTRAGGVRPENWPKWLRNCKDY